MKYTIVHSDSIQKNKVIVTCVDGEPVTIPGFEDYHFFTHEESPFTTDDQEGVCLSERSTGCLISWGLDRDDAIQEAIKTLNEKGRCAFVNQVNTRLSQLLKAGQKAKECDATEAQ
jgi:hypothetical protein